MSGWIPVQNYEPPQSSRKQQGKSLGTFWGGAALFRLHTSVPRDFSKFFLGAPEHVHEAGWVGSTPRQSEAFVDQLASQMALAN